MASTFFHRTMDRTTDSGYAKKWIFSAWIKISSLGATANKGLFSIQKGSTSNSRVNVGFNSTDHLWVETKDSTGNDDAFKETQMKFRDTNAWYHIYIKYDSTESTASDRLVFYVNGLEQTYQNVNEVGSNFGILMDSSVDWRLGIYRTNGGAIRYFDGIMSHVHFSEFNDSDTPTPYTAFGETDSVTGEWKIKTSPAVSYGSQGLFVLKDNNLGTDQSGQSNNLSASGTCTKTEDNPSNIFCTLNPLQEPDPAQAAEYTFGNTKFGGDWNHWQRAYGTIGANTGKFYYEFKCLNDDGTAGHLRVGWDSIDLINDGQDSYYSGLTLDKEGKLRGGIVGYNNYDPNAVQMTAAHSGGNFSFTTNDILGMAIDIDNNTFSVYKNGNLEINAYSYASNSNCSLLKSKGHFIAPSVNWYSASGNGSRSCFNFGNGYFETTAVSSAGTNASNLGIFEYDVPTGYTAFCTKGLNE